MVHSQSYTLSPLAEKEKHYDSCPSRVLYLRLDGAEPSGAQVALVDGDLPGLVRQLLQGLDVMVHADLSAVAHKPGDQLLGQRTVVDVRALLHVGARNRLITLATGVQERGPPGVLVLVAFFLHDSTRSRSVPRKEHQTQHHDKNFPL